MKEDNTKYTALFMVLGMIFVSCLIVSNLIAGKIWAIGTSITIPASVILFPVTYILSDVFTEVYGFRKARGIIWTGFACNFIAVFAYVVTIILPYPKYWLSQDAFGVVLGMTPRFLVASFAAYLFGEFSNAIIMSKLKVRTKGARLWERTITSSIVGEALDSAIFIMISFAGMIPNDQLIRMMLFQYLFKVIFEVVFTPVTYLVTGSLKKKEGIDTFDYDADYRLF